jgi:hypothetical protein
MIIFPQRERERDSVREQVKGERTTEVEEATEGCRG